jgi:sulfoxide reductase heme-binding subunit YedZ
VRLTAKQITWLKVLLHLAGLLPFIWLFWAASQGSLAPTRQRISSILPVGWL